MVLNSNLKSNILIIGPKPPPYHGVSIATGYLLEKMVHNKFLTFHVDLSDRRGIQHVDKPDFYDVLLFLKQLFKVIKAIYTKRPSIVYLPISQRSVGFIRDSFFVFVSLIFHCKIVMHLHGGNFITWYDQEPFFFRQFIRMVLNRISIMIVLSDLFKHSLLGLIPSDKIFVVPNGIEFNQTSLKIPYTPRKPNDIILNVLYLGTLNRLKGVLVLIKSIPYVISKNPHIRFIFAGPWSHPEDQKEAETFLTNNQLLNFVEFTGIVTNQKKVEVFNRSHIFVFPGIQQEGQPLVILEAMAAGLPILFTDRGCIKETVIEGTNGFQIDMCDSTDLADKILYLAANPNLLSNIAIQNRKRFKNEFSSKTYIDNMIKVFLYTLAN